MGGSIKLEDSTYTVTIVNDGYGNKYVVNTVTQKTLKLTRDATYTFNISDGTTHPFNISTQPDGGGTVYESSEGVSGLGTNTITWTVASNAPSTLYYYCGQHNYMGGSIEIKDATFNFSVTNQGNGMPRDAPIEITS